MSLFAWITMAILGATAIGFLAGMYTAEHQPPDDALLQIDWVDWEPGPHVFVVPYEYNGMLLDGVGYSEPPEFYDWAIHGECLQPGAESFA